MTQTNPEVAVPTQKFKRFAEKKFQTYEAAKAFQAESQKAADKLVEKLCKAKVVARNDGSYDVILYTDVVKAKEQEQKAEKVLKDVVDEAKKTHGLTAKARRSKEKRTK